MSLSKASMKWAAMLLTVAIVTAVAGCSAKRQAASVTAEQLEKSFQTADAATTNAVVQATAALQGSDYTRAVTIMNQAVQGQNMDDAQKKAVDALLIQTRKAVEQNPKLNNAQLYEAMSSLLVRVHGEN
jgi:hypothetical protein